MLSLKIPTATNQYDNISISVEKYNISLADWAGHSNRNLIPSAIIQVILFFLYF